MLPIIQNPDYHNLCDADDKDGEATGNDCAFQMPDENDEEERTRLSKRLTAEGRLIVMGETNGRKQKSGEFSITRFS